MAMNIVRDSLVIVGFLGTGLGCTSTANVIGGRYNPENGIITATASKHQLLHISWGHNDIGTVAQSNGIRYVLSVKHHQTGLPFILNKKVITIYGFSNKEALDNWKSSHRVMDFPSESLEERAIQKLSQPQIGASP
jgi:hypothetical protein